MIVPESSSARVVAMRGYSSVFMMVLLRQYQALVALMCSVRMPSTHLATLACMASTWSFMEQSGQLIIPRASRALCTSNRWMV